MYTLEKKNYQSNIKDYCEYDCKFACMGSLTMHLNKNSKIDHLLQSAEGCSGIEFSEMEVKLAKTKVSKR